MNQPYNHKNIRKLLKQSFRGDTLLIFCYDSPDFYSVYADLTQPIPRKKLAKRLINFALEEELMEKLLAMLKKRNPKQYRAYPPYRQPVATKAGVKLKGTFKRTTISGLAGRDILLGVKHPRRDDPTTPGIDAEGEFEDVDISQIAGRDIVTNDNTEDN
ncbi:hypothetical protein QUF58_06485 [Anaerolineales bacterium HSG24]|nr:hypothetical protein [Anaerolineales bacterium HSG24]